MQPHGPMNPGGEKLNEDDVPMTVTDSLTGFKPGDIIYGRAYNIPTISSETGQLSQLANLIMVYVTRLVNEAGGQTLWTPKIKRYSPVAAMMSKCLSRYVR